MNRRLLAFLVVVLAAGIVEAARNVQSLDLANPALTVAIVLNAALTGLTTGILTAAARYGLGPVLDDPAR